MQPWVFDLESNGLLDQASVIHCGVFKNTITEEVRKYRPNDIKDMVSFMKDCPVLIGHNIIHYDIPLVHKLQGMNYQGKVVDTMWMSRQLFPDLQHPKQMLADYVQKRKQVPILIKEGLLPKDYRVKMPGPHSIEAWGYRLGHGKIQYDAWDEFDEEMMERCEQDVNIQHLLFLHLKGIAQERGYPKHSMELTFELMEILADSERRGWPLDTVRCQKYINQLTRWQGMIERVTEPYLPMVREVLESKKDGAVNWVRKPFLTSGKYSAIVERFDPTLAGKTAKEGYIVGPFSRVHFRRMNLNSDAEVKDYLLSAGWQPEEWNYKKDPKTKRNVRDHKGQLIPTSPKLSQSDAFIGVNGKVGKLLAKYVQVAHRRSLLQGLLDRVRPDGTLGQVITGIAATGRLTHSVIVNIPGGDSFFGKQCRAVFVAPKGYKIVGTDASSCQDRMLAARADNDAFTEMLLNGDKSKGTDGHSLNMHAINKVLAQFKLNPITRGLAKNFGYGWKFGASDNKLGSMVNAGPEVGAAIAEALASVAPAQQDLVDRLTAEWESTAKVRKGPWGRPEMYGGTITGLDGRPVTINARHTILVYTLQSDEAIMMQYALVFLERKLKEKGWIRGVHYWYCANVHDEYQAIVREDLAESFAALAEKSIEVSSNYLKLAVPQAGEADIGINWHETH